MTEARKPDSDELAEDILGFARRELHTIKDLVLRPAVVLKAMMEQGPDGGGAYSRPLRLYFALSGIGMLILFLRGGADEYIFQSISPEALAEFAQRAGKSTDAFMADADGWMTLIMIPLQSLLLALSTVPLFRLWDQDNLGWKRGIRATFCWLNAWSILMIPSLWWAYDGGLLGAVLGVVVQLLGAVTFFRMGRGRWFKSTAMGVLKAFLLFVAVQIVLIVCAGIVQIVGLLSAIHLS